MRPLGDDSVGSASRRLSTFWTSPSSAATSRRGSSCSSGRPAGPHAGKAPGDQDRAAPPDASADPQQGSWLRRVVTGFYAYHAVPTNGRAIEAFRYHVTNLWRRSLRRRSQKDRLTWERITRLANAWLPLPRILHPWPNQRLAVKHPRQEPYAGCDRRSRYGLASASLVRPKLSKRDGSENCGRRGNAGSEA